MSEPALLDIAPDREEFLQDVVQGLLSTPKTLPSKYLYDERGSHLFDEICELDEYYLTRTELQIMEQWAGDMAAAVGSRAVLIEYGSGSSLKTGRLLEQLDSPAACVLVEISLEHLKNSASRLAAEHPGLKVIPVCADFTQPFDIPDLPADAGRRVVYFPGSTIGNFSAFAAQELLTAIAAQAGPGGGLLIGVDLLKSPEILKPAYNDSEGVTARFNMNLLERINRELQADFQLDSFHHEGRFNAEQSRMEMHLVSERDQTVTIGDQEIFFASGETIHTENSCKFELEDFRSLAQSAGLEVRQIWTDADGLFSVQYLEVTAAG